jgi:hypothetical protein
MEGHGIIVRGNGDQYIVSGWVCVYGLEVKGFETHHKCVCQ